MITANAKKILLADDSVFFRTKMKDVLVDAGHLVTLVEDGLEATAKMGSAGADFDLLILDLEMPNLDGFGVVEWMSENDKLGKFPVLIATGVYKESEAMARLKGHGVNRFITKEAPPEEIVFIVNKILFPTESFERVDDRTPIEIATTFTTADGELKGGVILNISISGLFLKTTAELPEGMTMALDFFLPGVEKKVEIGGVIKRVTKESAKDNRFGGVGIFFTRLSPMDKKAIEVFVAERLKEIRRPSVNDRKY